MDNETMSSIQDKMRGKFSEVVPSDVKRMFLVELSKITPNPDQPRKTFNEDSLRELADNIQEYGQIQPVVLKPGDGDDTYILAAGERRYRAHQLLGKTHIYAVLTDGDVDEIALIENIQREDLNPIETAQAYDRLARDLGLSHEQIAQRTGKDRASITNMLRLLKLPAAVQLLVAEHRISMGHARAILGLGSAEDQTQMAERAAAQGLSVRQVETLVQEMTSERMPRASRKETSQDPNVRAAVEQFERALGTRVRIVELSEQRGRIEIDYYSQAELDRLYQHIVGEH